MFVKFYGALAVVALRRACVELPAEVKGLEGLSVVRETIRRDFGLVL